MLHALAPYRNPNGYYAKVLSYGAEYLWHLDELTGGFNNFGSAGNVLISGGSLTRRTAHIIPSEGVGSVTTTGTGIADFIGTIGSRIIPWGVNQDVTILFPMYVTSISGNEVLMHCGNLGESSGQGCEPFITAAREIKFLAADSGFQIIGTGAGVWNLNTSTLIGISVNGSINRIRFYVNGVNISDQAWTHGTSSSVIGGNFYLGSENTNGNQDAQFIGIGQGPAILLQALDDAAHVDIYSAY